MPNPDKESTKVEPISDRDLVVIRDALSTRYGAQLEPGESLAIEAERTDEHVRLLVVIEATDDSFRLEVEGASVPSDAGDGEWDAAERFDLVVDLVDAQLAEYFENDRFAKLLDDWRPYEFGGAQLRLRGSERRPELEKLADAWLEAGGDPGNGERN